MVKGNSNGAQNGCQREMKRIENMSARQVCFSKHRNVLFNKASDLSTMCGAEVASLVDSPGGRPYTFGSPAVDPIINNFIPNNTSEPHHSPSNLMRSSTNPKQSTIYPLNLHSNELSSGLDAAKFRQLMLEKRLKKAADATPLCNCCENIEQMGLDQLKQLSESLYQMQARVIARQNELICAGEAPSAQIVNYPDPNATMMMASVPFSNQVVQQHEPREIDANNTPAFNPLKLYPMNIAAVKENLMGFQNPFSFGRIDTNAESSNQYDLPAPLEQVDSTTEPTRSQLNDLLRAFVDKVRSGCPSITWQMWENAR